MPLEFCNACLAVLVIVIAVAVTIVVRMCKSPTTTSQQTITQYRRSALRLLENNCSRLRCSDFYAVVHWKNYKEMCVVVNGMFFAFADKLMQNHLNEKEIRLCVLVLVDGFSGKQMSDLLFYSESGIRSFKNKTAKKLGTDGKNLRNYLLNIALNEG